MELLRHLVMTARDLSEPGEVNEEYVRGQVNLIHDAVDWETEMPSEVTYGPLFAVITHQITYEEMLRRIYVAE